MNKKVLEGVALGIVAVEFGFALCMDNYIRKEKKRIMEEQLAKDEPDPGDELSFRAARVFKEQELKKQEKRRKLKKKLRLVK